MLIAHAAVFLKYSWAAKKVGTHEYIHQKIILKNSGADKILLSWLLKNASKRISPEKELVYIISSHRQLKNEKVTLFNIPLCSIPEDFCNQRRICVQKSEKID
jgi:hypothetical protein